MTLSPRVAIDQHRDFLSEYLTVAPASLALIRANECFELSQLAFMRPVLDVGCGDGLFASQLFAEPLDAGLDLNADEVKRARRSRMYHHVERASAACIPFPNDSFATVFSNGVLEHVRELDAVLAEIARVLRPNGRLIATMPCAHFSQLIVLPTLTNWLFHHVNLLEVESWAARSAAVGLSLIAHRHYNSPAAIRAHQWLMPFSVGAFIARRTTGYWVPWPSLRRPFIAPLWAKLLRRFYATPCELGGSLWWVAENA